jgi:AraC-like DNA-binding protein/quercetin dioxygenase-like cupin family protein
LKKKETSRGKIEELSWLTQVKESVQPLTEQYPIWVRHGIVETGPTIPHPERHPYCEFSTILEGRAVAYVGREDIERKAGDYFLAGPGVAHWYKGTQYPVKFAAVYFLPSVLIEMGPISDGMQLLRRFTGRQTLAQRLVRPPPNLAPRFKSTIEEIIIEFDQKQIGHEIRLRTLLMELLVQILRWEQATGGALTPAGSTTGWRPVEKALNYIQKHFDEAVYAKELASVAGVSQSRLKQLFNEHLGMPWSRYLQGYRLDRAAALLSQPGHSVLETALAVGFESVSHFNTMFRSVMGIPPREYAKRAAGQRNQLSETKISK